ncbi:hypothetical protein CLF_110934 [Clonorchis sinensis]|uniref:Uncharacterized protein n=1 Tax=Clonorchis sinensis TaxID=79923 RepID=G7YLA7_CLOSI|nr:hypothetical protein CLF_110934 [Clonorchis sinensis]
MVGDIEYGYERDGPSLTIGLLFVRIHDGVLATYMPDYYDDLTALGRVCANKQNDQDGVFRIIGSGDYEICVEMLSVLGSQSKPKIRVSLHIYFVLARNHQQCDSREIRIGSIPVIIINSALHIRESEARNIRLVVGIMTFRPQGAVQQCDQCARGRDMAPLIVQSWTYNT